MTSWPQDYSAAWTLAAETSRSGVGLHSGAEATVELRPTDQPGFHMRLPGMERPIQLRPDQVRDSQLCTTLDLGSSKVATVEHLLAALAGCGLSHVVWSRRLPRGRLHRGWSNRCCAPAATV